mmetsp:Transcript_10728/g.16165  ORF Transcript_10728/g.16165 Transcript_10728/m.16165 type:complete len:94 (+) Transcript_10728:1571-1852(+)
MLLLRETQDSQSVPGSCWLYQARDEFPSLSYSDNSDTRSEQLHSIRFTPLSDVEVYIGVFGSPLGVEDHTYEFQLEVWQAQPSGVKEISRVEL